jgi:hypothetical protein
MTSASSRGSIECGSSHSVTEPRQKQAKALTTTTQRIGCCTEPTKPVNHSGCKHFRLSLLGPCSECAAETSKTNKRIIAAMEGRQQCRREAY